MKTLQNDYTTPEQSKRLLDLGVPADSANCYLTRFGMDEDWEVKVLNNVKYSEIAISNQEYCLPCWSVGRLMEIFDICFPESDTACWPPYYELDTDYITYVVRLYERGIMELDFSKLEE